jgi:PAS domain S-box-containing protein
MLGKDIPPYELSFIAKDKSIRIGRIHANPIRNSRGEIVGDLVMVSDLTEEKTTQQKFQALIEAIPDAVTATDLKGAITYASKRTAAIHGYSSPDELIGINSFDLISPEEHGRAKENLKRTLETGTSGRVEYKMKKKDGNFFFGELSAALIKDDVGNPSAFIATVRDVTERRKMQDDLEKRTKDLEKLNKLMIGRELKMAKMKEELSGSKQKIENV